jgi:hypothetical protein
MAPKRKAGEVPKPIEDAKGMIVASGTEMSVEAIGDLDHPTRNKAFGALRTHLKNCFPEKYKEFEVMTDELKKREWLATFMIDPASGGSIKTGFNETTASVETADGWKYAWLVESALGGPHWLNNPDLAKEAVKELESQPSTNPTLKKLGIHEYKWWFQVGESMGKTSDKAGTRVESDLSADHYNVATNAIRHSNPGSSSSVIANPNAGQPAIAVALQQTPAVAQRKRKRVGVVDSPPDPEKDATKVEKAALDDEIGKFKAYVDGVNRQLGEVGVIEARLRAKEWGPKAVEYLQRETEKQKEQSKKNSVLWAEYKLKSEGLDTLADMTNCKKEVQDSMTFAQTFFKAYKLEVLGEFGKIK